MTGRLSVKVIPTINGCFGGGIKWLKESIRLIFEYNNDKRLEWISREMQNNILWKSESLIKKSLWTADMRSFDLTNKFW